MTLLDTSVLTDHLFPIQLGNYRLEFSLNPDTVMYIPYSYIYGSHQEHNVNKGKNDTLINNRDSQKKPYLLRQHILAYIWYYPLPLGSGPTKIPVMLEIILNT